jgi:hypothetical protein
LDHQGHYPPALAFDGRGDTAWAVRMPRRGDYLEGCFARAQTVQTVDVVTGYDRVRDADRDLFLLNDHLREFDVELRNAEVVVAREEVSAAVTTRVQHVAFDRVTATCIRVVVGSVWRGSRWDDLALSEVRAAGALVLASAVVEGCGPEFARAA